MGAIVVLTTAPDRKSAQKIARRLVMDKLAACVTLVAGVTSIYHWKNKVEKSREALLIVKTSQTRWNAVRKQILSDHPYDLPEVIALPIRSGSKKYLSWLERSVR